MVLKFTCQYFGIIVDQFDCMLEQEVLSYRRLENLVCVFFFQDYEAFTFTGQSLNSLNMLLQLISIYPISSLSRRVPSTIKKLFS